MARPVRISMDELAPKLRALRAEGIPHKLLADRFGYSIEHIKKLCAKFGATKKKGLKPQKGVDCAPLKSDAAGDGIRASAVNAIPSAATEAKPSDTPEPGSHT